MNLMVLGGLVALVLLIDDAVIRAHSLRQGLRERSTGQSTAMVVREAMAELHRPLTYAALIVLLGLLPLFFLAGVPGAFSRRPLSPMALRLLFPARLP